MVAVRLSMPIDGCASHSIGRGSFSVFAHANSNFLLLSPLSVESARTWSSTEFPLVYTKRALHLANRFYFHGDALAHQQPKVEACCRIASLWMNGKLLDPNPWHVCSSPLDLLNLALKTRSHQPYQRRCSKVCSITMVRDRQSHHSYYYYYCCYYDRVRIVVLADSCGV